MADVPQNDVDDILRHHAQMMAHRANFETHWQEIEQRLSFLGKQFNQRGVNQDYPGERGTDRQWDITAPLAAQKFAAAIDSLVTPSTNRYHGFAPIERSLRQDKSVIEWCEQATTAVFHARYRPGAAFQPNMYQSWFSMGGYGNGPLFIDEPKAGGGAIYRSVHMSQVCFAEDESGRIDTVHRMGRPTIRQLAQRFGEKVLPEKIRTKLTLSPEMRTDVLLCVKPRRDYDEDRLDYLGMPFAAHWILMEGRTKLEESGYNTFPWAIARYALEASGEVYGRGPASQALPEIKMTNEMRKTQIRAGQRAVDPPVLLPEDAMLKTFNMRSNAMNRGYVNENGQALAVPFISGARMDIGQELVMDSRNMVNDAFLVNLFRILVDKPTITATEAMLLAQEKGQLLSPTLGRARGEVLGVIAARELDIEFRSGRLPPMPPALVEAGGLIQIEYCGPLDRLQQAEDVIAIQRTIELLAPLAEIDQTVSLVFKTRKTARRVAEIQGVPADLINTDEEIEVLLKANQQQQQQQQLLEAAPIAASAIKDLAQARATSQSSPAALVPA